jgi:hypothetical protein
VCQDFDTFLCVSRANAPTHTHIFYKDPYSPDFAAEQSLFGQLDEAQAAQFAQQCVVEYVKARLAGELVD